ncbi:MAG: M20/M25/M40 family metallo-hydrolase [Natronomonas sp.]
MDAEDPVELTARLASIPSHEAPTAAADAIEDWLRARTDATVERNADNVIARRGSGDPSLALVGHHDVVPPADRQVTDDGYLIQRRDGRLYGRGTADMKGSLAAAMVAFGESDPPGELVFASFYGEEQGGIGCRAAIEAGFAVDRAVVCEGSTGYSAPGVTDVAVAHKGRRETAVVAVGDAAHASEPARGENAIYRAADAVDVVRDLEEPSAEILGNAVEGSLVVTEIDGGSARNVVPERCAVTVDERTVPGRRAELERVESIDGVSWRVVDDLPPMACGDPEFAAAAVDAARHVADDGRPETVVKPHATDAGWLAAEGVDCVVCGAAEPGEAHTATESVSIDVLRRCRRIYRKIAETHAG